MATNQDGHLYTMSRGFGKAEKTNVHRLRGDRKRSEQAEP
ncbi:hypothetical protein [Bacteriophage sp.]|nr:hypothetical protein [Bacteriophage sp.]